MKIRAPPSAASADRRAGTRPAPTKNPFIALIETCWSDYPGCVLDVDTEAPELRALASYYRGRGGMLWVEGSCGSWPRRQ